MEPIHLYFSALGASVALSAAVILIVVRDSSIEAALKWSSIGLFISGATYSVFAGPAAESLPDGSGPLLILVSAAGVVLLWSIVRLLFDEHYTPVDAGRWPLWLIALGIALPITVAWWLPQFKSVAMMLIAVLAFALALHMLWILVLGRTDDLDNYRRGLRALLAGGGSIYVGLVLGAYFLGLLHGRPITTSIWLASGQVAFKLAWLFLVVGAPSPMTRLYRATHAVSPSPLSPLALVDCQSGRPWMAADTAYALDATNPDSEDDGSAATLTTGTPSNGMPTVSEAVAVRQATTILAAMEQEKLYRQQGLSIGRLADHVRLPEHRVRALINGHLQFKNYTAFLNHFRLREVARRLRDPGQAHLPILSIALDVGYASIAPFNRAFRDAFGQTPSEYRHGGGADPSDVNKGH